MIDPTASLAPSSEVRAADAPSLPTLALEMLLHDLAAPIRHIAFFTQRLAESSPNATPDQKEFLDRINQNMRFARSLLRDARLLLSQERLPLGGTRETVDMKPFLTDLVASFRPEMERGGLTLELDSGDDCNVFVDPQGLYRLLSNLLTNAAKATPRGGHVTVTTRRGGDYVHFKVADTGKGYSLEQADHLSQGWYEFDSGANPPGIWGGLGLLICHRIVMREGGRLSFVSDGAEQGSTFAFALRIGGPRTSRADEHTSDRTDTPEEVRTVVTLDPGCPPDMFEATRRTVS